MNHTKNQTISIHYAILSCRYGFVLVSEKQKKVCAIFLGKDENQLKEELFATFSKLTADFEQDNHLAVARLVVDWINEHSDQDRLSIPFEFEMIGTDFQRKVWRELMNIPAGKTLSYRELAVQLQQPKAIRAVASACANNHLAILVPCHRINYQDGQVSPYRWGKMIKYAILEDEKNWANEKIVV